MSNQIQKRRISLTSKTRACRIVARSLPPGRKDLKIKNRRIIVLCQKQARKDCDSGSLISDLSTNPSCMAQIIGYFNEKITDGRIDEVAIVSPSETRVYTNSQVEIIEEIAKASSVFLKEVATIKKRDFGQRCQESKICSRSWNEFTQKIAKEDYVSSDPIRAYINVLAEKRLLSRKKEECLKCGRDQIDFLERLRQVLLSTSLISKFLDLKLSYDENDRDSVYSYFLRPLVISRLSRVFEDRPIVDSHKLQEYPVGPFTVSILASAESSESFYSVSSLAAKDEAIARIVAEVATHLRTIPLVTPRHVRVLSLDELFQIREREALRTIGLRFPEISQGTDAAIAKLACYESVGVGSIAPFLIDDEVEEFFIDQPGTSVYLDHCKWGRCRSNVIPSFSELRRIETRLRAESGFRLDRLNPSLKTEVSTKEFMIRASLDVPPLAVDGFHLDVRKLERNRFSLVALIKNGTLSLEAAAYLYFCLLRRRNIVAIGEPGSGKTTLINALDLLTPSYWRKIALEDAIESIPQVGLGKHQVRLKVEPLEERKRSLSKGREIVSLLHRTPDLVYLGEIQTASHSRAMFHALSAGLTGLQTCHADSPEQAMIRWVIHHRIPAVCLPQIGVIAHMKKVGMGQDGLQKRKVVRISEVSEDTQTHSRSIDLSSTSIRIVDIFKWNPMSEVLEQKMDLYETPSLKAVVEFEAITRLGFEQELAHYVSLFQSLIEENKVNISATTHVFDGNRDYQPKQIDMT